MVVATFGTGQVFWSMLYFFLFFLWIWLVIMIFTDIFRSPDLSGWGKAMWSMLSRPGMRCGSSPVGTWSRRRESV